jgi:hypothetical protein
VSVTPHNAHPARTGNQSVGLTDTTKQFVPTHTTVWPPGPCWPTSVVNVPVSDQHHPQTSHPPLASPRGLPPPLPFNTRKLQKALVMVGLRLTLRADAHWRCPCAIGLAGGGGGGHRGVPVGGGGGAGGQGDRGTGGQGDRGTGGQGDRGTGGQGDRGTGGQGGGVKKLGLINCLVGLGLSGEGRGCFSCGCKCCCNRNWMGPLY